MREIRIFFLGVCFYSALIILSLVGLIGLILVFIGVVLAEIGGILTNKLDRCECILTNRYYGHSV